MTVHEKEIRRLGIRGESLKLVGKIPIFENLKEAQARLGDEEILKIINNNCIWHGSLITRANSRDTFVSEQELIKLMTEERFHQ